MQPSAHLLLRSAFMAVLHWFISSLRSSTEFVAVERCNPLTAMLVWRQRRQQQNPSPPNPSLSSGEQERERKEKPMKMIPAVNCCGPPKTAAIDGWDHLHWLLLPLPLLPVGRQKQRRRLTISLIWRRKWRKQRRRFKAGKTTLTISRGFAFSDRNSPNASVIDRVSIPPSEVRRQLQRRSRREDGFNDAGAGEAGSIGRAAGTRAEAGDVAGKG